jgi:hypothetical protein
MPATVTLSTTTLAEAVGPSAKAIKLTSTAGVLPGMFLFLDGELMRVVSLGVDPWVNVLRGQDATPAANHVSLVTVYIGRGDQFYGSDPVGRPPAAIAVSPWINVRNGKVFFAQGDTLPEAHADRWWQAQETEFGIGALGVRTKTRNPESST